MQVKTFILHPTKTVPNSRLPLLYYEAVFPSSNAAQIETKFRSNKWIPQVLLLPALYRRVLYVPLFLSTACFSAVTYS
jgi:hypothetical protein